MSRVYLSLGSNIDRAPNLRSGLEAIRNQLGKLVVSPVYESDAVGFDGPAFFNLVVGLDTDYSVGELAAFFHQIEAEHGRVRGTKHLSSRTLDIDILTYDDVVGKVDGVMLPRNDITRYAFVLKPLSDIAGDRKHPVLNLSYRALWQQSDFTAQPLWQVELP